MSSLYLGKVGTTDNIYEIHALTNGYGFREIPKNSIADPDLFLKLLEGRYNTLKSGHAIYCTAVNPDIQKSIENNPHDDREGTVHFVAIDKNGEIESALSVAVDTGLVENGTSVGLPLENKWQSGEYPSGSNLDDFRKKYIRKNRNEDRDILPYEMAELYRHFKRFGKNNIYARAGLYTACYHLLVREARTQQKTPTSLWVFDAIPQYFNLYKFTGAAVLRDYTILDNPRFISPSKNEITKEHVNGSIVLKYKGMDISRNVVVPIPDNRNGKLLFENENVPFLDGLVDLQLIETAISSENLDMITNHVEGFSNKEKRILNASIKQSFSRHFQTITPPL